MNKENIIPSFIQSQFKYTSIWNEYIKILEDNITVKKHRIGLKYYDNCFSGLDAVQTILSQVKIRPDVFTDNTNRRNVTRLCAKLLERGVLERVGEKSEKNSSKPKFEDSKDACYKFSLNKLYQEESFSLSENSNLEKECVKESARVRLLQLLDINFIDNIVASPKGKDQTSTVLSAITNRFSTHDNTEDDSQWDDNLKKKFILLINQSTMDGTDPVLNRGVHHLTEFLVGFNPGLFNGVAQFYRHPNKQHQSIELYN